MNAPGTTAGRARVACYDYSLVKTVVFIDLNDFESLILNVIISLALEQS